LIIMIIFFNTDLNIDVAEFGGKAKHLHLLSKVSNIKVPSWFCIPTSMFEEFIQKNKHIAIQLYDLKTLIKNYEDNKENILQLLDKIKATIIETPLDPDITEEIRVAYAGLESILGGSSKFAIRSSGISEDSENTSLAGMHDTFLNISNFEEALQAVKNVWASSFNHRAVIEKSKINSYRDIELIAVVVQQMVTSEISGTALSIELSSNYPGIDIAANYGFGETVVSGEVLTDRWLVDETGGYVIKMVLGDKKLQSIPLISGGTQIINTTIAQQKKFSLTNKQVLHIAKQVKQIKQHYGANIDAEFALDPYGTVYFVQLRPVVNIDLNNIMIVDPAISSTLNVLAKGLYSTPGVVSGTLRFITNWEELTSIQNSDLANQIIVTYRVSNVWSHYITQVKGLITKEGSPTSHPVLLARERGIPCLIGIQDNFENLISYSGQIVTIDSINKTVYLGAASLKKAESDDLTKMFFPVTSKPLPELKTKIEEFKQADMVIFDSDKYWLKTPTYKLKKFEQEINLQRFEHLSEVVGLRSINIEAKVLDGFACNVLNSFETVVDFFTDMTLSHSEFFVNDQKKSMQEYLEVTHMFNLTHEAWEKYVKAFIKFRAHVWLGGGFRAFIEKKIEVEAESLRLPQYYLEECYSAVQATLVEEDSLMQEAIFICSTTLASLPEIHSLRELELMYPEYYLQLKKLGEHYRFQHNMSLHTPLDLNLVFNKILATKQQPTFRSSTNSSKMINNEIFFPDNPTLYRLILVSMQSRVNQSNSHHYHIRGQWKVRQELLKLGQHMVKQQSLINSEDIFDLSIEEIKLGITNYLKSFSCNPTEHKSDRLLLKF
jgi:phosphohistidine swiveling domain-containing protein